MSASERRALGPILSVIAGNVLFGTGLIFHAFLYNFYLEALHLSSDVMGDAAAALRGALILGAVGSAASLSVFRRLQMPAKGMLRTAPAAQSVPVGTSQQATRQMLLLVGLVAVWMLGPALAAPFFNIFFAREHGVSIERIGLILAAANVCWALAVFASGEVARRIGVRAVLGVPLLFFAP